MVLKFSKVFTFNSPQFASFSCLNFSLKTELDDGFFQRFFIEFTQIFHEKASFKFKQVIQYRFLFFFQDLNIRSFNTSKDRFRVTWFVDQPRFCWLFLIRGGVRDPILGTILALPPINCYCSITTTNYTDYTINHRFPVIYRHYFFFNFNFLCQFHLI